MGQGLVRGSVRFFQSTEFGETGPNGNNAMSRAGADGNCARAFVTTRSMVALRVQEVTKTGKSATTSLVQVRRFLPLLFNY